MTTVRDYTDLFGAKMLATTSVGEISLTIYENRIYHVFIPQFEKVNREVIDAGYAFLDANGGGEFYNIFQFESFAEVDPETREWAASSDNNNYTICDAIVIGSKSQKLITDFYLRINRPVKPTKVFFSLSKAADWIKTQMH